MMTKMSKGCQPLLLLTVDGSRLTCTTSLTVSATSAGTVSSVLPSGKDCHPANDQVLFEARRSGGTDCLHSCPGLASVPGTDEDRAHANSLQAELTSAQQGLGEEPVRGSYMSWVITGNFKFPDVISLPPAF